LADVVNVMGCDNVWRGPFRAYGTLKVTVVGFSTGTGGKAAVADALLACRVMKYGLDRSGEVGSPNCATSAAYTCGASGSDGMPGTRGGSSWNATVHLPVGVVVTTTESDMR